MSDITIKCKRCKQNFIGAAFRTICNSCGRSNTHYLRCAKCGCDATPRKWNRATPEIPAECGTNTRMLCNDCCPPIGNTFPYDRHATMCRDCCPTGHGTRWETPNANT